MNCIENAPDTKPETLSAGIKLWASENNIKLGAIMTPLRIALVGELKGPSVFAVCGVLGKSECVRRIAAAIDKI
jgi:glutamyl-tRNA synthetase